jgi:hypothetical protein
MRIAVDLATSLLKAVAAVAAIIFTLWLCGWLEIWGKVGVGAMTIILLGIFWSIFYDTAERSWQRVGAFCLAYFAAAQIIYLVLEPRGLVRSDLRFVLELVALSFGACLLFSSNGSEDRPRGGASDA